MVLLTGHRRENIGDGFPQICSAVRRLSEKYPEVGYVWPVHLNPSVREVVHAHLADRPNVHLIEPLSYRPFVALMNHASIILTDSGGIQEEAPALGKPVLVLRSFTERPEGVEAGTAKLVGTDPEAILEETSRLLENEVAYRQMADATNPYGDGQAAARIVQTLKQRAERLPSKAES
jgi:UDP-N-acetylglucosamine 2-epimerase (non-hydrolysing)